MKTVIKTTWHVMKNGEEVWRTKSKKMAEVIAREIGGFVHKSTVELVR